MVSDPAIRKVLVIGSGPIIIGQAAEFDYAGTQACKALREEGVHSVLVNSNPATIMTDQGIADTVYIEPLTVEVIGRIIERERPDGILPTLGGQTGLNLAVEIADAGLLDRYGVRLLGTPLAAIKKCRRPGLVQAVAARYRGARAAERFYLQSRECPGAPRCSFTSSHRKTRVYARWNWWRHRPHDGGVRRPSTAWSPGESYRADSAGAERCRLEGNRVPR